MHGADDTPSRLRRGADLRSACLGRCDGAGGQWYAITRYDSSSHLQRCRSFGLIRLSLLGSLDVRDGDGREVDAVARQPKRAALLAYMAVARPRTFYRRDELLALFWPERDERHARDALSSALHFLRCHLRHDALGVRGMSEVRINSTRLWCDVAAFDDACDAARWGEALELYRGDLLLGFHVGGAPAFDEWLESERSRLRERAKACALALAAEALDAGALARAASWARVALRIDNFEERALRLLMRVLIDDGEPAIALREFATFERRLREGLGASPASETLVLRAKARAQSPNG